MARRIRAVVAIVALLALVPAAARGIRIGHRPVPPRTVFYTGSDAVGEVKFKTYAISGREWVEKLQFANRCSSTGSMVKANIRVGPKHHFSYKAHGHIVHGSLHGKGFKDASGTVRIVTASCDSGVLSFTATKS